MEFDSAVAKADFVASSMFQLVHDYSWEVQVGQDLPGWGFCSTASIVLGSALVPFGLIYPTIGVLSNYSDASDYQRVAGHLNLEILDVNGQPFQCNCCDLQLLGLKALQKMEHDDLMRNWKSMQLTTESGGKFKNLWEFAGDDTVQIDIRSIHRYDNDDDLNQICARDSDKMNGKKPKDKLEEHGVDEYAPRSTLGEERKRKIRKHYQKSNDYSWSLFSKEALCCSHMVLEEAYFLMGGGTSKKSKFIKCWMKQCNMEGGFFGDFNLSDYVETLIKNRYSETLGDVIHQIYERMDLLLFHDEEDEFPNLLLNSEDSNHSLRERPSRENSTSDHNDRTSGPPSSEDSTFPWGTSGFGNNVTRDHNHEPADEKHTRMADEARERRERARRFSSFTRGVLDLQRVWAPKQSKSKSSGSLLKPSRKSRATRESYDKVCETPESEEKRPMNNNADTSSVTSLRNSSRSLHTDYKYRNRKQIKKEN
ncbi:hypothetical protein V2J09_015504 [Rumex salicifolius]